MGNEGGESAMQRFVHKLTRKKEVGDSATELHRCLGVGDLIMMGIGGMVGSGIYFLIGETAKEQAGKLNVHFTVMTIVFLCPLISALLMNIHCLS